MVVFKPDFNVCVGDVEAGETKHLERFMLKGQSDEKL